MSNRANAAANVIGILSGKGGVGKTTLVANLGAALASEFDKKVLIVDTNVKTSHLGFHLGLYEELPLTLREVLLKKAPAMYAIYLHPTIGLRLLPAPIKGDMDLKKMDDIIKELKSAYDPILLDCAPGLGRDVVLAVKSIDKALLVTTPDLPAVTDALKTINLLKKLKKDIIGIVLNRVRKEKYELTVQEIESTCGYDVIGVIPETNKIAESIAEGMPLVMDSNCSAAVEFKRIAGSLIGKEYQPAGLWYKLKDFFVTATVGHATLRRQRSAAFVRETELDGLKTKRAKEERVAIEKLRSRLKKEIVHDGKFEEDIERKVMEKIAEKLRKRMRAS